MRRLKSFRSIELKTFSPMTPAQKCGVVHPSTSARKNPKCTENVVECLLYNLDKK